MHHATCDNTTSDYSSIETISGYFERTNPEAYSLMYDMVTGLALENLILLSKCTTPPPMVPAPRKLRDLGVEHVAAFPVSLLAEHFGS